MKKKKREETGIDSADHGQGCTENEIEKDELGQNAKLNVRSFKPFSLFVCKMAAASALGGADVIRDKNSASDKSAVG